MNPCQHRLGRLLAVVGVMPLMAVAAACGAVVDKDRAPAGSTEGRLPQDVARAGKLVVATGDYKVPTHFRTDKGELVGLNIDLAKALGDRLGVKLELVAVPFDAVLAGIQAGRYDTALYNVADSPERRKVLDFADYAVSGLAVATRKGQRQGMTTDPLSLCGHSVAVTGGQYEFQVLNDKVQPQCKATSRPAIDLQTFQNSSAARNAVDSGRVEALVDGVTTTPYMVSQNADRFELVGTLEIGTVTIGMPFAKGRAALINAIVQAWKELWKTGEYQRIAQKWSLTSIVPTTIDQFTVNSGEGVDSGRRP